jgi:hypothetical protein
MKKFTFVGCSITRGEGLLNEKLSDDNYANIVGAYFDATVNNLSKSGNSNFNIFITALNELLYNSPDVLFLQWSGLQRHFMYPHLDSEFPIVNCDSVTEISILNSKFSKRTLQQFTKQFLLLNHDYHNILQLLNYCKILETIAGNKIKIININGLLPWTKEILYSVSSIDPAKYFSPYTKDLLSIDLLPDEDIRLFFNKIHTSIKQIDKSNWVNMFENFISLSVDLGSDNAHPGPESHKKVAKMIIDKLNK